VNALNVLRASSQVVRLSTLAAFVCTMPVLYACSDANTLQPFPPGQCDTSSTTAALLPPGSYYLANVDGAVLPIRVEHQTKVLDSGRIDLRADSTYSILQFFRAPGAGPQGAITDSTTFRGTFSRCGKAITFHARFGSGDTYHASVLRHVLSLTVPSPFLNTGRASGASVLVYVDDPHAYQCGSESSVPSTALGSYTLISAGGFPLPVLLEITYPSTITFASGTATIATSSYGIQVYGTVNGIDSTVVVASDSGTVEPCSGALKFTSTIRDTSFVATIPPAQLTLNLPASLVDYDYNFLGDIDSIPLLFQRNP
jgi:hypothetical protein